MGGKGSGRWVKHKCKKLTDNTLKISIRQWISQDKLIEGNEFEWCWLNDNQEPIAKVGVKVSKKSVEIYYDIDDKSIYNLIYLDCTQHSFGDIRVWFSCPLCKKRVADLYLTKEYFHCRNCCRLGYRSQRKSR